MGLDLTQFAYYERGSLKYANSVGIAGREITLDLVEEFNTSYDEADQAKEQYGHAFFDLRAMMRKYHSYKMTLLNRQK